MKDDEKISPQDEADAALHLAKSFGTNKFRFKPIETLKTA